jgi:G3E family GTPase
MSPSALPTTILGGFLGAGKTTLVNHLLRTADGRRITVMVNDFGELAIDRDLIVGSSGDTVSLANGCVCCSTGGDLLRALGAILDQGQRPDHLLIEASGVADPDRIGDIARADRDLVLHGVVVLADSGRIAGQIADPRIGPQVARQFAGADLVVLNKADQAPTGPLTEILRSFAPKAALVPAIRGALPREVVLGDLAPRSIWRAEPVEFRPHETAFTRWIRIGGPPMSRIRLNKILSKLPDGVLRLKGFVRMDKGGGFVVQAAPGWANVEVSPKPVLETRLVAIGLNEFDPGALDTAFPPEAG